MSNGSSIVAMFLTSISSAIKLDKFLRARLSSSPEKAQKVHAKENEALD